MKRRSFLRHAVMGSLGAATLFENPLRLAFRSASAAGLSNKTLVVVFQRGGCDGLNTVVPHGDTNYYAARGDSIAVPRPGSGELYEALDLDGFFGLHPSMAPLHDLYVQGRMAIMPAVHFPGGAQSHFENQSVMESGADITLGDGWLNRYLAETAGLGPIRGVTMGTGIAHSLVGDAKVTAIGDLAQVGFGIPDFVTRSELPRWLERMYGFDPAMDLSRNHDRLVDQGRVMLEDVALLGNLDVEGYVPENGAVYPGDPFGQQLRNVAQLIKEGVGLEVVTLDIGGWDFHQDEGGAEPESNQSMSLARLSNGIGAFMQDLQARQDDVMVLTMTEFGRTLHVNGGNGTDHGRAAAWFAVGGGASSGVYGDWPGLAEDQLLDGRHLNYTVDYRDILGEILTRHLGVANPGNILPGYAYSPLGFVV